MISERGVPLAQERLYKYRSDLRQAPNCREAGEDWGVTRELILTLPKNEPHAHYEQGDHYAKRRIFCCGHGLFRGCRRAKEKTAMSDASRPITVATVVQSI